MKKQKLPITAAGSRDHKFKEPFDIIYADSGEDKIHLGSRKQLQINAHMARWFFDFENNQMVWSDGIFEILELNSQKIEADYYQFLEVVHPEDRHIKKRVNEELIKTLTPIDINYRLLLNDGRIKWINEICNTDFDENRKPIRSYGTIQDITRYKINEENFQQKEKRINNLIELFPSAVIITQNNRIMLINSAGEQIFRVKNSGDLIGESLLSIITTGSRKLFVQKLKSAGRGELEPTFECKIVRNDGNIFDADITIIPIMFRGSATIQLIINDLSEYKATKSALHEVEKNFNYLTENLSAFLLNLDLTGNITQITSSVFKVLGYKVKDILGLNISRFLTADSYALAFRGILDRRMEYHDSKNPIARKNIFEVIGKSDLKRWIEITTYPILDSNNVLIGISGICHDVTERQSTEDLLRKNSIRLNDLNATRDKFFTIIAHDLRAPFNSTLGLIEIIQNEFESLEDSEKKSYIKLIEDNTQSTLAFLDNLLEWSKKQTGKLSFQPVKLSIIEIIEEVAQNHKSATSLKNLILNIKVPDNLEVFADEQILKTILNNLLNNAIKYSFPDGEIEIKAESNNNHIEFMITDFGIGMTEDVRNILFRIDEHLTTPGTANEKGSGLGLLICKDFIDMHQGKIWVESKPNEGSRFIFTIPNQQF
jgi:PAS domain S-box-containing protein